MFARILQNVKRLVILQMYIVFVKMPKMERRSMKDRKLAKN